MILRCSAADDAVRAVRFAREKQLDVAVRSGGHDLLGASICDGMVVDLSPMKGIRMNREEGSVRVEAGVRAAELNAATQAAGLAVPLGRHPAVGVAGGGLAGGLGVVMGKHWASFCSPAGA